MIYLALFTLRYSPCVIYLALFASFAEDTPAPAGSNEASEGTTGGTNCTTDGVVVAQKVLELAELMDWEGILSVLGTDPITKSSPTPAMRKQYMKISLLIHPDKLRGRFSDATKAFQVSPSGFQFAFSALQFPFDAKEHPQIACLLA